MAVPQNASSAEPGGGDMSVLGFLAFLQSHSLGLLLCVVFATAIAWIMAEYEL